MEEIKNYLQAKGLYPKVDFDDKLPHTVKILKAREDEYEDGTTAMKVLVQEGKDLRVILATSILIEIQDCKEGDVYKIQMKYKKIGGKPIRTYDVQKVKDAGEEKKEEGKSEEEQKEPNPDVKAEDIPIVEDEETEGERPEDDPKFKEAFGE